MANYAGRVARQVTVAEATDQLPIARLGGFVWTREDFCSGRIITGDTGSGKTRSGITPLPH